MRSRFVFEKMALLVLTLCLLFVFSACGGGQAVKSDQAAKNSGIIEAKEVKPSPQSAQSGTPTEKTRDGSFIAYDNGTVLDTRTNLMWAAEDNGSNIIWASAKSYCLNYRGGGYTDWRMPTQDELAGLYDKANAYKSSDCGFVVNLTKLIRLSCPRVWASETRGNTAACFIFDVRGRTWEPQSTGPDFPTLALPVRSVK
jgi:hypothetical protein